MAYVSSATPSPPSLENGRFPLYPQMHADMKPHDNIWNSFRSQLEKEISDEIRQNLQTEFERKLLDQQEAVCKELKEQYERELNEYKMMSEARLRKMEKNQQKFDKIMEYLNGINGILKETEEQTELSSLEPEKRQKSDTDSKEEKEELHPLLSLELRDFLVNVAQKLDPTSFLMFTRSNKKLRALAVEGSLKTDLTITCTTYEHSGDNLPQLLTTISQLPHNFPLYIVPVFNKKPLGFKELGFLHSANFFKVKLECLCLVEKTNQGRSHTIGVEAMELLDHLHVQMIEHFQVEAVIDLEQFLMKHHVNDLRIHSPRISPSFLQSEYMNKIEKLDLSLFDFYTSEQTEKAAEDFLLQTRIPKVNVNERMDASLIPKLVQSWLSGARNYKHFYVELESNCASLIHDALQKDRDVVMIDRRLERITLDEFKQIVNPLIPCVYRGIDNTFICIRNDMQILKIHYGNTNWRWVTLHNMAEKEEDDVY